MDPIMIEKLQAMKSYRRKTTQLLQTLFKLLLTILSLGLFLSSPLWLPLLFTSLKIFIAMIFDTKCLFVVCNIIIVILLGQSKLSMSSPSSDIYEEYVSRNKSLQKLSEKDVVDGRQESRDEGGEEGDKGLDELNRRVEDFIARVNKQRRIEARMVGFCGCGEGEGCNERIKGDKIRTSHRKEEGVVI